MTASASSSAGTTSRGRASRDWPGPSIPVPAASRPPGRTPSREDLPERRAGFLPRRAVPALALCAALVPGGPRAADADKSRFTLLDPTPLAQLREFNPDRPGLSHDPTTIDAGHIQVESGALEHVFDPRGPSIGTARRYSFADTYARIGVTDSTEFQLGGPVWNLARTGGDEPTRAVGGGDTTIALKTNLLGNDGGDHILALYPSAKLPTAPRGIGNGYLEYTLSAPYNYKLNPDLLLTVEPSVSALRNADNTRYRDGFGLILGLDQTVAKVLIASIEVATQASTARKEHTMWATSPSLALVLSKSFQLDCGAVLGLNKATPRYQPYVGLSARF